MKMAKTKTLVFILLFLLLAITNIGVASESGNVATTVVGSEENEKSLVNDFENDLENDIPYKKDEGYSGANIVKILFAFVIVVLIAFAAIFVLRRYYYGNIPLPKGDAKNINLIETKRISPKLVVFLLDVQGEKVLLAQSGDNLAFYPKKDSAPDHSH
jgi:hypothetical protein